MVEIPFASAPEFKLTRPADPPGKMKIYLTIVDGKIIQDFNRPIQWVGYTPEEAEKMAHDLLEAVRIARTIHVPPGDG